MLGREEVEAAAARAAAATPGPWPADYVRESVRHIVRNCDFIESADDPEFSWDRYVDAPFIAHAITDVPALADTALSLMDEVERLTDALHVIATWNDIPDDRTSDAHGYIGAREFAARALAATDTEEGL